MKLRMENYGRVAANVTEIKKNKQLNVCIKTLQKQV